MKNILKVMFKKITSAALSAALLLGGAVVALPLVEESGIEANAAGNSFDNPMDINVNQNYTDRLTDWDDKDYYKFTLTSDAKVSVNISHDFIDSSSTYWRVSIYKNNNSNDELYAYDFKGSYKTQSTANIGLPKGTYFLKVEPDWLSDINYTIRVNATYSGNWEKELNEVYETASKIAVNKEYSGSINSWDDVDFYKFTLSSASKINIKLSHNYIDSSSTYWRMKVYKENNSNDEIYSYDFHGNNKTETTANIGLPKGSYYIRIEPYSFSDIDYKLKVTAASVTNWEKEENDVFETATKISLNKEYSGSIKDWSDVDFYKFSIPNKMNVKLAFKHAYINSSSTYWKLKIFKENNTNSELYDYYYVGNKSSETEKTITLPKGNYYIRVDPYNLSCVDYTFKIISIVTPVKLNKTSASLAKGKSVQLTANQSVTWSTSNSSIATVKNGKVTAKKVGTVTITAKAKNGKKATCKVTVKNLPTKVKLNKTKATIKKGKTLTLKATVTPSKNVIGTVKWSSSNKKIATVNSKGKITAKKAGTVTITVKTTNGKTAKCKITVKK